MKRSSQASRLRTCNSNVRNIPPFVAGIAIVMKVVTGVVLSVMCSIDRGVKSIPEPGGNGSKFKAQYPISWQHILEGVPHNRNVS